MTVHKMMHLMPDWFIEISDDEDVNAYLKLNLSKNDWKNLEHKHIVEKIDVWRLIKIYNEGGLYTDIDRLCNRSLEDIVNDKTRLVLPTCLDHDFSHDFMCSAPQNPIFAETLKLNLNRRARGANSIYFLGPQTYLHGIMIAITGHINESFTISMLRDELKKFNFCVTIKEEPPYNTVMFSGVPPFDHEIEKRKFYNENGVNHWTNEW